MQDLKLFFQKVYGWMFVGLLISGLTAYCTYSIPVLNRFIIGNPWIMLTCIIIELILAIVLGLAMKKMSPGMAGLCFALFSLVNGLTLSVIFMIYTIGSISLAFFITAGLFGLMSILGMTTNLDLSKIGTILLIGLFGIIIASLVNLFLNNPTIYYVISIVSILIFTGLTAYDTQKLKQIAQNGINSIDAVNKIAIFGALQLYLDFINLFLSLLRIFGKEK